MCVIICYFPNSTVPVRHFPYLLVTKIVNASINFASDVQMMNNFVTITKTVDNIIKKVAFAYILDRAFSLGNCMYLV